MTKQLLLAGAALSALIAMPAYAQDAAGAATSAEDTQTSDGTVPANPGDIVVTAQRRSERLQDVPIAITVISGDAISAKGAVNIEGAQYLVPALNFRKSGTSINQSLFLRGVGTSTFSIAGEPSVSTVVDGVVFSRAGEAFSDLVDIERIEVLRGPQGTLFGKNASAGVVNIVSKRPTDEFGGMAEGGFYFDNGREYRARAAVNVPFSDGTGLRVTGFYGNYDGNIFNAAANVNRRVNGYEHYGVRGIFVAEFSPDITLTLIGDWRRSDDDCCAEVIGTTPGAAGTITAGAVQSALGGAPFLGDESRTIRQNLITRTEEESYGGSAQLDLTLDDQTVTSITSYRRYDNTEIRDGDFLDQPYVGLNQLHDVGPQSGKTFTQELRLTSPGNEFVDYVIGGFYSWADTERTFTRNDIVCLPQVLPVTTLIPCGSAASIPSTFPTGTATFGSTFKNLAFFGQATINVTDRFGVIGGLRYSLDQLDVFHSRTTALAGPGIAGSFGPFRGKTTNTNLSSRLGLQYELSRQSSLYATFAMGYKGPAFNVFFNLGATGTNAIEPETADSFEIGSKNSFFNGRLVLNLAAYYAKYKNFQANNPDTVAGVLVTRFTNAGDISTRGGEIDLLWRPVDDLTISGGLAYTDAKVDQFRVPSNGNITGVVPSGTVLGYAPEFKGSLGIDYRLRTGSGFDFGLGAQGSYQSEQLAQFDANPAIRAATTIKGYGLVDLSASIMDSNDRFRLTFQVKNVFDQSFAAAITSGGPGGSFRYLIPREADRYFGVTGRINFGEGR